MKKKKNHKQTTQTRLGRTTIRNGILKKAAGHKRGERKKGKKEKN